MSDSTELRRIVGAMTEQRFCMCGVGRFASSPCAGCLAKRALANHADALVQLLETVERQVALLGAHAHGNPLATALATVHAIPEKG